MRTPGLILALVAALAASASADVENQLVFTRQGGGAIAFPANARSYAWCGPYDDGSAPTPTLHVMTYDTTLASGRHWRLWAIPADVVIGQPQLFPNRWTWPNPDSVELYVGDPPNEASTETEESSGWIVFQELDCAEGGTVAFTIDARVGSEFGDGPWIGVTGSFRATVTRSPFTPVSGRTWGAIKAIYR
jgi:hypothetical protein